MFPYQIDWAATGSMLAGIGSLIAAATFIASAFVAWRSYQQWKEKEHYLEDRKLAIDILAAFEEGKGAIMSLRYPLIMSMTELAKSEYVTNAVCKHIETQLERKEQTWALIEKLKPQAKAVFGIEVVALMNEIIRAKNAIGSAVFLLLDEHIAEHAKERAKKALLIGNEGKGDPLYLNVKKAGEHLEQTLTPYIRSDSKPKKGR